MTAPIIDDGGEAARVLLAREDEPGMAPQVAAELVDPHALVARAAHFLGKERKSDAPAVQLKHACLDISATGPALERALRIADALVQALEKRGLKVEVTNPRPGDERYGQKKLLPSTTGVTLLGERVEFALEEGHDRIRIDPPPQPKRKFRMPDGSVIESAGLFGPKVEYQHRPNGKLALRITNAGYGAARATWGDGRSQRVEGCLHSFLRGMIDVAEGKRCWKVEQQRRELAAIEERKRQEALARARAIEAHRQADLDSRLADWQKAQSARAFAALVQAGAEARPGGVTAELTEWLAWAHEYADWLEREAIEGLPKLRPPPPPARSGWPGFLP